jgi:hypothetical protein
MAINDALNYQNENELSGYPLRQGLEVANVISDASFIQFDNFVPVLKTILVDADKITVSVLFDSGLIDNITFLKSNYSEILNFVRVYQVDPYNPTNIHYRFLGTLTFGSGLPRLWSAYVGRKIVFDVPFTPETVRSIPSSGGVYTFDGCYGAVDLGSTQEDSSIFYNSVPASRSLVFNAVAGHVVESVSSPGLKMINLVKPLNNNINIISNDVIKFNSFNAASLTIDLVAGSPSGAFKLPNLNN